MEDGVFYCCFALLVMEKYLVESLLKMTFSVILLPAHPASFAHNFVSGMQRFYFSESQDAIILQTCHFV